MSITQKQKMIDAVVNDFRSYADGFWITLNTLSKSKVCLDRQVAKLTSRLNIYCYGKKYHKDYGVRFRIVGIVEQGNINQGLHMHLVVMHNKDITKSLQEINGFIRKHWYKIIKAKGSIFGTLVDVQEASDLNQRIDYMCKTFYNTQGEFNPIYY